MTRFYARMQQRRGTAAEWTAANPVLQAGELGYETDTEKFKIGNGTTAWNDLDYWEGALPDQTSNAGKFLTTDGTDASWADVDALPSQSGFSGYFLTTDGSVASWAEVDALPSQTGNAGYYLKTDGTTASWDELSIDDLVTVNVGDLGDVTITGTPADGEALLYDSTSSEWINAAITAGASVTTSTTAPSVDVENGDLWWNSEEGTLYVYFEDYDADGYWVEATAGTVSFLSIADLSDTNITTPSADQILVYDGSQWVNQDPGGGGLTVSATAPASPDSGDMWFNSTDGKTYVYYADGDSSQWVEVGASVSGAFITVSSTAPSSPETGALWWDPDNGNLYVYYNDGDSSQWVAANGPQVFVGTSAPAGYQGQLWFDSSTGKTYIYYDDGTTAQWVSAIGGSIAGTIVQVVSTSKTDTFSASITTGNNAAVTGLSASITPRSTSSKIMVMVQLNASDQFAPAAAIARDGTLLNLGDAAGNRNRTASLQGGGGNDAAVELSLMYLDSPGTTSSVTYQVHMINTDSITRTAYVNRSVTDTDSTDFARNSSTITLMEVAG